MPDGGNRPGHRSRASDLHHEVRPAPAGKFAYLVLRIWNNEVLAKTEAVAQASLDAVGQRI